MNKHKILENIGWFCMMIAWFDMGFIFGNVKENSEIFIYMIFMLFLAAICLNNPFPDKETKQ